MEGLDLLQVAAVPPITLCICGIAMEVEGTTESVLHCSAGDSRSPDSLTIEAVDIFSPRGRMEKMAHSSLHTKTGGRDVKSYIVPIVVEPDEDVWRAYVPELESQGAATWGHTADEALRNMQEVMQMIVEEYLEDGKQLPDFVTVSDRPTVSVNV